MKVVIKVAIATVFLIGFIITIYYTYFESKVWLFGQNIKTEILSIDKIGDDEYNLKFQMGNKNDIRSKIIPKKAYDRLKDEDIFEIRYLSDSEIIYLELNSRNDILGLVLALLIFGFLSWKSFERIV